MESRGASNGSSGTSGSSETLSFSTDGRGVCVGVLNAPDLARAEVTMSASVASESKLCASLVRIPASSLLSSNDLLSECERLDETHVPSLSDRSCIARGAAWTKGLGELGLRLRLCRRR